MINTTHYNLYKPDKSEKYNIDIFNQNSDIIDSALYSLSQSATSTVQSIATQDIQNLFI